MLDAVTDERMTHVTLLLDRIRSGDDLAGDQLMDMVYHELRGLAGGLFAPHRHANTLQPTALVHEAWLKLAGHLDSLESRRHFFAVAAKAMRQVLADRVRDARRQKRGGGCNRVILEEQATIDPDSGPRAELDMIDLNDKLDELATLNARHARVVEMRLLACMTTQEIADELELSRRTVELDWNVARAWLRRELRGG